MKILKGKIHFLLFGLIIVGVISCDKDFNTIGADFVGADHFNTDLFVDSDVATTNYRVPPVRANNNLSLTLLGRYNDPVYGTTDGSVINQVTLNAYNPSIGDNAQVKEVVLTMPYYSTQTGTDSNGAGTYELDSIFGSDPIRLSFHRTNFFLKDFDPDAEFQTQQLYYTDEGPMFDANMGDLIYEDLDFYPSADEVVLMEFSEETMQNEVSERLSPRLRVVFDETSPQAAYFQSVLLDPAVRDNLISQSAFQDYFRGIHITTGAATSGGNRHAMMVGLDDASIVVTYTSDGVDVETGETTENQNTITINFSQKRVNTLENVFDAGIESHIANNDDNKLYLKGGEGSIVKIDLFGPDADSDGEADQLTQIKGNNWLINEANLEFYVDRATVQGGRTEPERIFIYNIENNTPLIDFFFTPPTGSDGIVASHHLGVLERDEFDKGIKYKVRITEHIKNIITRDSTNAQLGLVVSSRVEDFNFSEIRGAVEPDLLDIPSASVYSPKGTVLFNEDAINEEKKLKLNIYYTEQDN